MKKNNLKRLALYGITGALAMSAQQAEAACAGDTCQLPRNQGPSTWNRQLPQTNRGSAQGNPGTGAYRPQSNQKNYVGYNDAPRFQQQGSGGGQGDDEENGGHNGCGGHGNCSGAKNVNILNEQDFVRQLNDDGRKLFNSLDKDGKQLAMRLAKQYVDKNQAVKQAASLSSQNQGSNEAKGSWQYNSYKRDSLLR